MVTLAYANIYILIGSTLVEAFRPVMTEVVGSSQVIGNGFPHFNFFPCKQTCRLEFMGFMINIATKQLQELYYTLYSLTLIRICLVMRKQNTHKNMKLTINKVVEQLIYVLAVFKSVCKKTGSQQTRSLEK